MPQSPASGAELAGQPFRSLSDPGPPTMDPPNFEGGLYTSAANAVSQPFAPRSLSMPSFQLSLSQVTLSAASPTALPFCLTRSRSAAYARHCCNEAMRQGASGCFKASYSSVLSHALNDLLCEPSRHIRFDGCRWRTVRPAAAPRPAAPSAPRTPGQWPPSPWTPTWTPTTPTWRSSSTTSAPPADCTALAHSTVPPSLLTGASTVPVDTASQPTFSPISHDSCTPLGYPR